VEYAFLGVAALMVLVLNLLWAIDRRSRRNERNLVALMAHLGVSGSEPPEPSDAVKALAADPSRKIAAIEAYRIETGLGLLEAKEAIERLTSARSSGGV
jgi:ribosomal protein L7/L12